MKSIFSSALLLLLCLAVGISAAPSTIEGKTPNPARCPNAQLLHSDYIAVGENKVTYATFSCDHSAVNASALAGRSLQPVSSFAARDATECTDPVNCRCGQTCVATCNANTVNAPTLSNCQTLGQALKIVGVSTGIGQTFFVNPGNAVLFFFGDCGFEWDNLNTKTTIEYCWDDFANTEATLYNVCLAAGSTNKGGSCLSVTDDWQLSFDFV
ncbi:hypothetical protein EW146_g9696 [Bondarzewia mesenterica]|uniref:Uncharacterized protein n=1 Tax=Bondarzewia mesenterica TaxID=1095465 RepID=A0A4S4L992_9AGAM|nr:hypothetical protein EW146_g9696 [Bondarzewia mesenterica]